MGNAKAKPVINTHLVLETEAEKVKCVICFEETKDGLKCKFNHLICQECVTPLINSVITDVGRLKDQSYGIRCPSIENGVQCQSDCFNASVLRKFCDSDTLDRYVKVITDICRQKNDSTSPRPELSESVIPKLLDALNLRCPNKQCRTVMDPSPDGCCAVRCAACATYTCFLCFRACKDSTSCHQHVRDCVYSPKPDELFISESDRKPALKRIRVLALREVLVTEFLPVGTFFVYPPGSAGIDIQALRLGVLLQRYPGVSQYLVSIQQELYDVNLTPEEVLELDPRPVRHTEFAQHHAPEGQEPERGVEEDQQGQEQDPGHRRRGPAPQPPHPPLQHPAPAAQRPQQPPTWRAVALGVLTFFVVFAACMYGFYILASVTNRTTLQGRHSPPPQPHQPPQQQQSYIDDQCEPSAPSPYITWYQQKRAVGTTSLDCPYSAAYSYAQCASPALLADRAQQLATGLSCTLEESDSTPSAHSAHSASCEPLWTEPSAMVVFGEGLVQLTVMVCVLSMAVLFGCLVLDIVSKQTY